MASSKLAFLAALLALAAAASLVAAQNSPQNFVDLHNTARAAVGVGSVTWDDTVAAYAQSYAAQRQGDCVLKHSTNSPYGENIVAGPPGATVSAAVAVRMWVDEKRWYDHATNSCSAPVGRDCLHYMQVVWRDTTVIGCAFVDCNNGGTFLICSYSPRGNIIEQSPY